MSRDEFITRWRFHVAGGFSFGYYSETNLAPLERVKYQCDVANHVTELLGKMYDSAVQQQRRAEPAGAIAGRVNGTAKA